MKFKNFQNLPKIFLLPPSIDINRTTANFSHFCFFVLFFEYKLTRTTCFRRAQTRIITKTNCWKITILYFISHLIYIYISLARSLSISRSASSAPLSFLLFSSSLLSFHYLFLASFLSLTTSLHSLFSFLSLYLPFSFPLSHLSRSTDSLFLFYSSSLSN